MDAQQKANVFRMSATLFANNNYQISPVQLHKRVVEDALFVLNNDEGITLGELSDYIEKEYYFSFDENELLKVLQDSRFNNVFEWRAAAETDTRYFLKKERREILNMNDTKTLGDYIDEYLALKDNATDKADTIYQYLYGVFTTNVDSFKRMLEAKDVKSLTEHYSPKEEDTDIINGFLDWDNEAKNIAIFNLASYALEFCLLTCKKGSSLKLESLKHKTFYLDTNILYRAIGINGEDRKLRSLSFLRKLKESEDEIRISKVSWEEYEGSLKNYIKLLRRSKAPAVHSKVFTEYVTYDDIYRYYHLWASTRHNSTIDLFVDWLNSSMKSLMEEFEIKVDILSPYSLEKEKEKIQEMTSQIRNFGKGKPYETASHDAQNILWVEANRKPGEATIFSTKTFLLSSDRGLYVWDSKYHSKQTPIVVMPSQWLSLLLRYVARSKDDFRSFVCFLNIQDKEGILTGEQINSILAGIAEMTNNVEQQKYFLETIVEREFKDGAKGKTNDQLRIIARNETERLMQAQIDQMQEEQKQLTETVSDIQTRFNEHKSATNLQLGEKENQIKTANEEIHKLKGDIQRIQDEHQKIQEINEGQQNQKDERIKQLEAELKTEKEKNEFNNKRRRRIVLKSIGCVALIALYIWFFCTSKTSTDLMGRLLAKIAELDETQQYVAKGTILLGLSGCFIPLIISLLKDILKKYKE